MSTAGFPRFFKSRTEIIFTGFINEIRLSKAQKLLIESSKSIHDISLECGYRNLSYFNRQFRLHNNISPKGFREYLVSKSSEVV
jgi:transcriptional regulator GlxA family with amidase domain